MPFGESFLDPGAVAYDPADGELTHQITASTLMDADGNGFTVTYTVQNASGQPRNFSLRGVEPSPSTGHLRALLMESIQVVSPCGVAGSATRWSW